MEETYGLRDSERGLAATVAWLTEELGELAQAVRKGGRDEQLHELGDVLQDERSRVIGRAMSNADRPGDTFDLLLGRYSA